MRSGHWAGVDQLFSSATNFFLSLATGRFLGASALGSVSVGFSIYLLVLGLARAVVSEPLIARTAQQNDRERGHADARGFAMVVVGAIGVAAILATVAVSMPSGIRTGLMLFMPWLVPSLVSDYTRSLLYRDDRGRRAAFSSLFWLVSMGIIIFLGKSSITLGLLVFAWGAGASISALNNLAANPLGWSHMKGFFDWWSRSIWPVGRWLGLGSAVVAVGAHITVVVVALLLGTADAGGLRAIQSLFAPISLVGPVLALPGLPRLSKLWSIAPWQAVRAAIRLSSSAVLIVVAALFLLIWLGGRLLELLYGPDLASYHDLILPVGLAQLFAAAMLGVVLLLKAQQRAVELLAGGGIGAFVSLLIVSVFAHRGSLLGAAWGITLGTGVCFLILSIRAFGSRNRPSSWGGGAKINSRSTG